MRDRLGDGFGLFFGVGTHSVVHPVTEPNKPKPVREPGWASSRSELFAPLGLRKSFFPIGLPFLWIAWLTMVMTAIPLHAWSDQDPFSVFQECGAVTDLPENHTSNATLNWDYQGTSSIAGMSAADARMHSCGDLFSNLSPVKSSAANLRGPAATGRTSANDSKESSTPILRNSGATDRNRNIYYKNKLEFSLEGGWLPINIPFAFDFLLGGGYNVTGLNYTLAPVIASVRWQVDNVRGPFILRGNWDVTFSASVTAIPRGPENRYFSYMMGIRRNFVPHRWRIVPYVDGRAGLGLIDAKGPLGVEYAQGQNFTFTISLGSGVRYNFNSRYAIHGGLNYMHISNLYLSEPKFFNYGINVYGPLVGIDIRFGKRRPPVQ